MQAECRRLLQELLRAPQLQASTISAAYQSSNAHIPDNFAGPWLRALCQCAAHAVGMRKCYSGMFLSHLQVLGGSEELQKGVGPSRPPLVHTPSRLMYRSALNLAPSSPDVRIPDSVTGCQAYAARVFARCCSVLCDVDMDLHSPGARSAFCSLLTRM